MSINFAQFPQPRLPLQGNDLVVGYQLIGSVPTLAQYTLTQMFLGVFPGGVVPVSNGGTGLSTVPAGDLLVGTGTNTMNFIIPGAAGAMLISQGTSVSPQFGNNPIINGGSITNTPISGSTGAFTTLSTPAVTITGGSITNTPVSGSTGAFTTVSATGTITPSQTAGVVGTTTNNNANAGSVGEFRSNTTGPTAVLTGIPMNATSVSLTAGDWDVSGTVAFMYAGGAVVTAVIAGVSTVSVTFGGFETTTVLNIAQGAPGQNEGFSTPVVRISLAATTTVFLPAFSNFAGGTGSVSGFIRARRIR